jgi:DNA-binding beta-propeller fold protein YncE
LNVKEFHVWPVPPVLSVQPAPRCVCVGVSNQVYVLDTAGRVLVYGADGELRRQWSMPEVTAGKPEGVLEVAGGEVVVCDTHYHRVLVFDATGAVVRVFGRDGKGPGEFVYPVAVTRDDGGNLYIAEYGGNDRIQVFAPDGRYLRGFGSFGTAPGQFQRPSGIVWRAGRVYVADAFNNRVQVFGDDGQLVQVLPTPALGFPYGISLGPDESLYVVEYGGACVTRLGLDGRLLARYGRVGRGVGEFSTPWGLDVASDGTVIVADTGNRRLVALERR